MYSFVFPFLKGLKFDSTVARIDPIIDGMHFSTGSLFVYEFNYLLFFNEMFLYVVIYMDRNSMRFAWIFLSFLILEAEILPRIRVQLAEGLT